MNPQDMEEMGPLRGAGADFFPHPASKACPVRVSAYRVADANTVRSIWRPEAVREELF